MLMRVLAPNLWGWLADRTGRRLSIVRLGAACTLLCFSGIYLGQGFAWLALLMAGHAFFWHADSAGPSNTSVWISTRPTCCW